MNHGYLCDHSYFQKPGGLYTRYIAKENGSSSLMIYPQPIAERYIHYKIVDSVCLLWAWCMLTTVDLNQQL